MLVAALWSGGACAGITDVQPGQPFELKVGQTAVVADSTLALRFEGVPQDSRCPMGVMCVWAGDAVVRLALRTPTDSSTADLHTNPGAGSNNVRVGGWRVELGGVTPPKRAGQEIPPGDYVATLLVKPL